MPYSILLDRYFGAHLVSLSTLTNFTQIDVWSARLFHFTTLLPRAHLILAATAGGWADLIQVSYMEVLGSRSRSHIQYITSICSRSLRRRNAEARNARPLLSLSAYSTPMWWQITTYKHNYMAFTEVRKRTQGNHCILRRWNNHAFSEFVFRNLFKPSFFRELVHAAHAYFS